MDRMHTVNPCSGPMMCTMPETRAVSIWEFLLIQRCTLTSICHTKIRQAELLDVLFQSLTLSARVWLGDESLDIGEVLAGHSPSIMDEHTRCTINMSCQNATHGTLWSTVAKVQSGRRTDRVAFRLQCSIETFVHFENQNFTYKPSNAWGLVTSCTKCLYFNSMRRYGHGWMEIYERYTHRSI